MTILDFNMTDDGEELHDLLFRTARKCLMIIAEKDAWLAKGYCESIKNEISIMRIAREN